MSEKLEITNIMHKNAIVQSADTYAENADIAAKKRETRLAVYSAVKRVADIFLSLLGLFCLSPLFLIIVLLIRLDSPGKAIYTHRRVGRDNKTLKLYKFRTMDIEADNIFLYKFTKEQRIEFEKEYKLENDPRITRIGKFLRKTSLDELPQLVNILKGELSIVGPRPVTEAELSRYGDEVGKFLSVPPGLTGYWQVNGRNAVTYQKRVELDMQYIDDRSLFLDIKIVFMTVTVVFTKTGN